MLSVLENMFIWVYRIVQKLLWSFFFPFLLFVKTSLKRLIFCKEVPKKLSRACSLWFLIFYTHLSTKVISGWNTIHPITNPTRCLWYSQFMFGKDWKKKVEGIYIKHIIFVHPNFTAFLKLCSKMNII